MNWFIILYNKPTFIHDCNPCTTPHTKEDRIQIERRFQEKVLLHALTVASFWKRQHAALYHVTPHAKPSVTELHPPTTVKKTYVLSKTHVNFIIANEMNRIRKILLLQ